MSHDPVGDVLARAAADLTADEGDELRRLVREGLSEIDPVVGPDDLAIEIGVVARIPPSERLGWSRRFAAQRRSFTLLRRSFALLESFHRGADVTRQAEELLGEVEHVLEGDMDDDIRYELGDVALESCYILSGGTGPASLRTHKAH